MENRNEVIQIAASQALEDHGKVAALVNTLSTGSRRERQISAAALGIIAKKSPEILVEHIDSFIDALNRPEAQTRWECLEVLTMLVEYDSRTCGKALAEVETALFDEESGPVRLGAMRFLCKYGATTANRSTKVWPLIDEGIQCYHGDLEFNDMLLAIIDFSSGSIDSEVAEQLVERMKFDAENGKGTLQKRARQIVENAQA